MDWSFSRQEAVSEEDAPAPLPPGTEPKKDPNTGFRASMPLLHQAVAGHDHFAVGNLTKRVNEMIWGSSIEGPKRTEVDVNEREDVTMTGATGVDYTLKTGRWYEG